MRVTDLASGMFHSCAFESNQAQYMGGAAYIYGSSSSVFVMSMFAHNYANDYSRGGGAVALEGAATVEFKQSVIDSNRARTYGGGVYLQDDESVVSFSASTITSNRATSGGAVYANGEVSFANSMLQNCSVTDEGAAVYSTASVSLSTSVVQHFGGDSDAHLFYLASSDRRRLGGNDTVLGRHLVTTTDDSSSLSLDSVRFGNNNLLAIASEGSGNVVIRNAEGLSADDVPTSSLGLTCSSLDLLKYCPVDYCVDTSVGIECFCSPDGVVVDANSGVSCLNSARITVPVTAFSMSVTKPNTDSTIMLFSNSGDEDLVWQVNIENNPESVHWVFSPSGGNQSQCDLGNVTFSVDSTGLQARAARYTTTFTLASNSLLPTERSITVVAHVFVSAMPSVMHSSVVLHDTDALYASGTLSFDVLPIDSTGILVLDAPEMSYIATLSHRMGDFDCKTSYYSGECALPALIAGDFSLSVANSAGSLVGSRVHNFSINRCPESYLLDSRDGLCKCEAGSYDTGVECASCPSGQISSIGGSSSCSECVFPKTSNVEHTSCTECVAGYYWDSGAVEGFECISCPPNVLCEARSQVADWQLDSGYWRANEDSTEVKKCSIEDACPGLGTDDECVSSDSFCACGYRGPLCSVCSGEYFRGWSTQDECKPCGSTDSHTPSIVLSIVCFVCLLIVLALVYRSGAHKNVKLAQFYNIGKNKALIIVQAVQVISQFTLISSNAGSKSYPEPAAAVAGALGISNLDVLSFLPLQCFVPRSTFYNVLLIKTVGSLSIALLPFAWPLFHTVALRGPHQRAWLSALEAAFLWLDFIVTSTSTTVAQVGGCRAHDRTRRRSPRCILLSGVSHTTDFHL